MSELVFTDAEGGEDEKELMESLKAYSRAAAGDSRYLPFTIVKRAPYRAIDPEHVRRMH